MNKFITLALFALCATMAHGQIIYPSGWNSNLLSQQSSSGSSASAAASADSATSSNNGLISSGPVVGPYVGSGIPLVQPGWAAPIVQQGLLGPVIAGPVAPQGWVSPVAGPWLSQGYPTVGALGPCAQGLLI